MEYFQVTANTQSLSTEIQNSINLFNLTGSSFQQKPTSAMPSYSCGEHLVMKSQHFQRKIAICWLDIVPAGESEIAKSEKQ